jgi:hypothetical protein
MSRPRPSPARIIAALFLQVASSPRRHSWLHVDLYGLESARSARGARWAPRRSACARFYAIDPPVVSARARVSERAAAALPIAPAAASLPSPTVEAIYQPRAPGPGPCFGITLGVVEGATVAVLVKQGYATALAACRRLSILAVALVAVARRRWPTSSASPGQISPTAARACSCWRRCRPAISRLSVGADRARAHCERRGLVLTIVAVIVRPHALGRCASRCARRYGPPTTRAT